MRSETPYRRSVRLGLDRYNTGRACKHGHLSDRYTSGGHCIECVLIQQTQVRASVARKEWQASYRQSERAKKLAAERNRKYNRSRDPKVVRAKLNAYRRSRPELSSMYAATRRSRLLAAMPPWVDISAIHAVYVEAVRMSVNAGQKLEVDHIYPLAGRNSCGLHVPWNLQIVPMSINRRKSNKHPSVNIGISH